jgi:hypothetical protein
MRLWLPALIALTACGAGRPDPLTSKLRELSALPGFGGVRSAAGMLTLGVLGEDARRRVTLAAGEVFGEQPLPELFVRPARGGATQDVAQTALRAGAASASYDAETGYARVGIDRIAKLAALETELHGLGLSPNLVIVDVVE